jgi:MFS family permease
MATATLSTQTRFSTTQKKLLLALASAVGLRMLGLFLVLPVFTLYGLQFTHSRFLVGFAFGCYGLAMACLEIPLGRLSDRIGRRKVLLIGMSVFSVGSFLCAAPTWFPPSMRIGELIAARFIQGVGTITSTAFATVADTIPAERRSTAMAVIGIPIGASFMLGVIGGPFLADHFGTRFLFVLTGVLGLGSVILLVLFLRDTAPRAVAPARLGEIIRMPAVLALDLSGFFMNIFMTAFWFNFPLIATVRHHLRLVQYDEVLVPMLLISGVTMFGFSRGADHGWGRGLGSLAFLILVASALLLFAPSAAGLNPRALPALLVPGTLFLVGFTALEPILPNLVSQAAPSTSYGTALGGFQTFQFLGSFAGGAVAGALAHLSASYIMATLAATSLAGCLLMFTGRAGQRSPASIPS